MRKQFAVFDIDGTITRVSLLQQIVREFVARDQMDVGIAHDIENLLHDYRQIVNDTQYEAYMNKVVQLFFSSFPKGLKTETYDSVVQAVVNTSLANTYVYTRELIQALKKSGFFLIAMSDSELRAVSGVSKQLGFDAWIGNMTYLEEKGIMKGQVQMLRQSKPDILKTIIQKFDLETKGSMAIGDTTSDIELLEMVDSPIVFNPNQTLFKHAKSKGWMLVLERKDMVYGMSAENGQYILKTTNS